MPSAFGGARTPEELETLLEDAFVLRDQAALAGLFENAALLVPGQGLRDGRGREEIARVAGAMWELEGRYFANPRRVLQVGSTALVLAERAVNVARRGHDGSWRYAISFLDHPSSQ
jgi:hypothetical protein